MPIDLNPATDAIPYPHYVVHGRVVASKTWVYEVVAGKLADDRRAALRSAVFERRPKMLDLLREFPELPGLLDAFGPAVEEVDLE